MKPRKRLSRFYTELGVGGHNVNLLRNHAGKENLPLWLAALVALWGDAKACFEVRMLS